MLLNFAPFVCPDIPTSTMPTAMFFFRLASSLTHKHTIRKTNWCLCLLFTDQLSRTPQRTGPFWRKAVCRNLSQQTDLYRPADVICIRMQQTYFTNDHHYRQASTIRLIDVWEYDVFELSCISSQPNCCGISPVCTFLSLSPLNGHYLLRRPLLSHHQRQQQLFVLAMLKKTAKLAPVSNCTMTSSH